MPRPGRRRSGLRHDKRSGSRGERLASRHPRRSVHGGSPAAPQRGQRLVISKAGRKGNRSDRTVTPWSPAARASSGNLVPRTRWLTSQVERSREAENLGHPEGTTREAASEPARLRAVEQPPTRYLAPAVAFRSSTSSSQAARTGTARVPGSAAATTPSPPPGRSVPRCNTARSPRPPAPAVRSSAASWCGGTGGRAGSRRRTGPATGWRRHGRERRGGPCANLPAG